MREITSARNARVLDVAELQRARARRERGRHLVEGPHAVHEAVRAGVVEQVYLTAELRHALDLPGDLEPTLVPDHVMARMSDAATPQGVVAVARTPTATLDDVVGRGLSVVLYEVADPGNMGTIVRTADAAGAAAVIATAGSTDPFGPKSVRSAAGSTYHLPVVVGPHIDDVLAACRAAGQHVIALDGRASTSIFDIEGRYATLAVVLGNEAHGLPDGVLDRVDDVAAVPIHGRAESLNVAAAAAVALYAAGRGLHRSS